MLAKPLKNQTQPTANSCVCTCLAMLMDEPAADVIERYHARYYEKQTINMDDILREEGFIFKGPPRTGTLLPYCVYLLTVASLNVPGGLHQIIVDYRDADEPVVFDPAKGYTGRKYYSVDRKEIDDDPLSFELYSWIIDYIVLDRG